jgi:hypothetical protein
MRRSYSFGNGLSKSSISEQPSPMNNEKNLAIWSRTQSGESKRPSSCPTVASASPRIRAPAVLTPGSAWDGRT